MNATAPTPSKLKLAHLFDSLRADFLAIDKATGHDLKTSDPGTTGLKTAYRYLDIVSHDRAYDDIHPFYQNGNWTRVLPFDGRDYCFYYDNGADDTHVASLLRAILKSL
jgi:hypothetical protein